MSMDRACSDAVFKVVQLHWGFALGGVAKYSVLLQDTARFAPLQVKSICLLSPRWAIDRDTLKRLEHTSIHVKGRLDPTWLKQVRRQVEMWEPDLVMTHGFNAHFVNLVCRKGKRSAIPWVCSYHGLYHATTPPRRLFAPFFNLLTEHVIRHHSLSVVAVADYCRQYLIARGVPAEKICCIHNGLKDERPDNNLRHHMRKQWAVDEENVLIGIASRLDPVKGVGYLFDAMSHVLRSYPRTKLVVLGDGSERKELFRCARTKGLEENVLFLGNVPNAARLMSAFDIFALPSLAEYHSIALLEAMRSGRAIIATDVGGNPESITHGKEGLLVPPANAKALEEATERLISAPELRRRLGEAARQRFLKEFTQDVMLRKTANWLMASAARARGSR